MQSTNYQVPPKKAKTSFWLKVSRTEFLPANSASFIIGVSWGLTLPLVSVFWDLVVPSILVFTIISLVGVFAAQINTMSDFELDKKDQGKKDLVLAMTTVGRDRLKKLMIFEISMSFLLLLVLIFMEGKLAFVVLWALAVFLAYAYSAPPLRFKSRSFVAPITLMIVLSILPVTFVAYVYNSMLDSVFWLFLAGQALTVYGVIVPAEIRDYFSDKSTGTITMAVRLGLVKACLLGIILLGVGGTLCVVAFILKLTSTSLPILSVLLLVLVGAYLYVLSKYWKLLNLSKQMVNPNIQALSESKIVDLASKNPKWITIVTQAIVFMCLILLIAKII